MFNFAVFVTERNLIAHCIIAPVGSPGCFLWPFLVAQKKGRAGLGLVESRSLEWAESEAYPEGLLCKLRDRSALQHSGRSGCLGIFKWVDVEIHTYLETTVMR